MANQAQGLDLATLLQLLQQSSQSQQQTPMNNQWGAFSGYPNAMNNAMGQMWGVNSANQQASLYNNGLNAQLGQANILGNSNILQALYDAQARMGVADLQNQGQQQLLNNPFYQEVSRGNMGTNIADAQGRNNLNAINARGGIANDLFSKFTGILNGGGLGGVGAGAANILQGFQSADGSQSAMLPQRAAGAATGGFAPASAAAQPAATQQQQPGAMQPFLQSISARGGLPPPGSAYAQGGVNPNPQLGREYLAQYLAQGRV